MAIRKPLALDEKLDALRKGDHVHEWRSLDDRRCCILCDRTFSGRQVQVSVSPAGRVRLRCPSADCPSTPREWVHPGNPLTSRKAWLDWSRILSAPPTKQRRKLPVSRSTRSAFLL